MFTTRDPHNCEVVIARSTGALMSGEGDNWSRRLWDPMKGDDRFGAKHSAGKKSASDVEVCAVTVARWFDTVSMCSHANG